MQRVSTGYTQTALHLGNITSSHALPRAPLRVALCPLPPCRLRQVFCSAVKFQSLYDELRVAASQEDQRPLPNDSLADLIDSMQDDKQAKMVLRLMSDDVSKRLVKTQKDWPVRRRLYSSFAERAIEIGATQVLIEMLQQEEVTHFEKYYIAQLIWELGTQGVEIGVLEQLLDVQRTHTRLNKGLVKGLRSAYWELLKTCDTRKLHSMMGRLYLQAQDEGVSFSEGFTQKLKLLAKTAQASPKAGQVQAAPVSAPVIVGLATIRA